jgi:hypothetical protein
MEQVGQLGERSKEIKETRDVFFKILYDMQLTETVISFVIIGTAWRETIKC